MQFTPPQYQSLQWAARYRGIRKLLRRSSIGLFLFAIFCVFGGLALLYGSNKEETAGIIILSIGGVFFLQVLLNITIPQDWLFISQGILFIVLGSLFLLSVCGALIALNGIPALGILIALWAIGAGTTSLQRYKDYRGVPKTTPPQDLLDWVNTTANMLRKTPPSTDPNIIEFKAQYQMAVSMITWRGRLAPDSITLTDKAGVELLILDRNGLSITPGKPVLFRKSLLKASIVINNQRFKGTIDQASFERFMMWMQSGYIQGGPMLPNGPLWVPRA